MPRLLPILVFVITISAEAQTTAIICKQLINGKSDTPISNAVVLIENDRIKAIGGKDIIPKNATIIDLSNYTILPGLIDAHVHPLIDGDDYQVNHMKRSSAQK